MITLGSLLFDLHDITYSYFEPYDSHYLVIANTGDTVVYHGEFTPAHFRMFMHYVKNLSWGHSEMFKKFTLEADHRIVCSLVIDGLSVLAA